MVKRLGFHGAYLLPVIFLPLVMVFVPLIQGEALFWGLPLTQFVPWRVLALEQWMGGEWPLWNPLNGMGAPLLANYQLAFFYPPGWVLNLIGAVGGPPWMAWGYLLVNALHLSWAGVGMMAFLRGIGIGRFGQMVGGMAFAMCGFFVARIGTASMIWAGAWLPWILTGGTSLVVWAEDGREKFAIIFLAGAMALQLLAGHAQLTWYSLVLLAGWVLFRGWNLLRTKRFLNLLGGGCLSLIGAIGASAVQLIPTMEYLLQSQRSGSVDFELGLTYSFWPWRFLTFLSPDFFGNPAQGTYFGYASYWEDAVYLGLIPFLLSLSTLTALIWRRGGTERLFRFKRLIGFLWIVIAVGIILALGKNLPVFPFLYQHVPTFGMFNAPARWMFWVIFALAALAGIGAEAWTKPSGNALRRLKLITIAAMAVTLGALVTWLVLSSVRMTFITATATAGILASAFCILTLRQPADGCWRTGWQAAVIAVIGLDLLGNSWGLTPTTDKSLYASHQIPPSAKSTQDRIFTPAEDEYALKFSRFFRFDDFRPVEDWGMIRTVLLANTNILDGISAVNNFDPFTPGRYARVMAELRTLDEPVKTTWLKWMHVGRIVERDFANIDGIHISELNPWDRFRWVGCWEYAENDVLAMDRVRENLLRVGEGGPTTVVLEGVGQDVEVDCVSAQDAGIEPALITSQRIQLHTKTSREGYIIIGDVYYPGWDVAIDGNEVEVMRADYLFFAVRLPTGEHEIEVIYRPKSFYIGLLISGITAVIVILSVIFHLRTSRQNVLARLGDKHGSRD